MQVNCLRLIKGWSNVYFINVIQTGAFIVKSILSAVGVVSVCRFTTPGSINVAVSNKTANMKGVSHCQVEVWSLQTGCPAVVYHGFSQLEDTLEKLHHCQGDVRPPCSLCSSSSISTGRIQQPATLSQPGQLMLMTGCFLTLICRSVTCHDVLWLHGFSLTVHCPHIVIYFLLVYLLLCAPPQWEAPWPVR